MSNLNKFSLQDDLATAIDKSLPSGEFAIQHSSIFTVGANWIEKGQMWCYHIDSWSFLTLTNVAYRFYQFQLGQQLTNEQEAKKISLMAQGLSEAKATRKAIGWFGSPATILLPEIVFAKSLPLSEVSSNSYHETDPGRGFCSIGGAMVQAGYEMDTVGVLQFNCGGEHYVIYSPFSALAEIFRQADAIKSGAAIASSIISTEASLTRLKSLLDEGVISHDEFEKAKSGLVGRAADLPESTTSTLRQLNSLFLDGVLTEAEFKAKKFEVLARS